MSNRQRRVSVRAGDVRAVVAETYRAESAGEPCVSVALVNDERIRALNDRYLGHDWATDALAFPLGGDPRLPGQDKDQEDVDGEVVVSGETAAREAEARGSDPRHELLLYVVHGTLHLLGWNDDTPAERTAMNRRAETILRGAGVVSRP